ncbi:hypothetical protein CSV86_014695 [Pseudomonas putida CSV86]|uniref:Uncharacterized protein n=1 Tax=Pseudomonas bharatica CSV86 TaxID=1005395 RepID=L1M502_9PSED|nr:hypothetical protein [Pseudomonas bharatica]NNJ16375.1 hypothetical protein [Pseudomonas bharatica CSV86]
MSHQFKPGDLALIVGAFRFVENIGKTCTLVQHLSKGDIYQLPDGRKAVTLAESGWLVEGDGIIGLACLLVDGDVVRVDDIGVANPRNLMPLRGDFEPEQQKAKEAEPCA